MGGLIEIRADLYDVSSRLREIDPRYTLYYNVRRNRYEIYVGGALQIVAPFARLDARTVEHVRKTRVENRRKLLAEMETHNLKLETSERKAAIDRALAAAGI